MNDLSLPQHEPLPMTTDQRLEVRACDANDAVAWNNFLADHNYASFFHLYEWKPLIEATFGHECVFLGAFAGAKLTGILPITFLSSRLFGRVCCSMPFVDYAGPVTHSEAARQALLEAAKNVATERGARSLEVRSREPLPPGWVVLTHKQSFVLDLKPGAEAVFESMSRKHRKNVRRALKNDLQPESGGAELLDEFFAVLQVSWRNLGSPLYSKRFFAECVQRLGEHVRIFVLRHQGRAVAVALNGVLSGRVDGLWAGTLPEARALQANYVLYWRMIEYFTERGCTTYSLGRSSTDSTAEQFKEKWNASGEQLYWGFWPPSIKPRAAADDPKYRLATSVWKHLPLAIAGRVGPLVAPYFP